jgi:hypothetical protein
MPKERISACLIVQDEQERLPAALRSVAFCDETIVVDGGSTDRTIEIARAAGATVIENPWPGFAVQRNTALDAATGTWILEIDADERVSPPLRTSIEALLADPPPGTRMGVCALRNRFLGRPLGPSAKYPAYRSRVFRRSAYRHNESRAVHEGIEPCERPLALDGDLEHELAGTLGEALSDTWRYARLESLHVARPATVRAALTGIVLRPAAKLGYRTIVDGGWRDGWRGMLKIALDAASDMLVWTLALLRGGGGIADTAPDGDRPKRFGRRPTGPVKIVVVAGPRHVAQATRWLAGLDARGLDVALICDEPGLERIEGSDRDVPRRVVKRLWPLTIIRALEIETQMRTTDAVIAVGARARLMRLLAPPTLRPRVPSLSLDLTPEAAAELLKGSLARR